jgi:hypothetical protein
MHNMCGRQSARQPGLAGWLRTCHRQRARLSRVWVLVCAATPKIILGADGRPGRIPLHLLCAACSPATRASTSNAATPAPEPPALRWAPFSALTAPAWCMQRPHARALAGAALALPSTRKLALRCACTVLYSTAQHSTAQHSTAQHSTCPCAVASPVPLVPCRSWYSSLPSSSPLPRPGTSVVRHHSAMRLSGRVGSSATAAAAEAASRAIRR